MDDKFFQNAGMEILPPNKDLLDLVRFAMDQNRKVLDMNEMIIRNLTSPIMVMPKDKP